MSKDFSLGGKILHIDLTSREISTEPTAPHGERFLGGMGISAWKLLKDHAPGVSALDPGAVLAFNAGVLVGTIAPTACRLGVLSRNVMTGGFGSASAGGHFAPELKYAGYDQVFVIGKASKPVYVRIDDDDVSIEDASPIWGKTTWETDDFLRNKAGSNEPEVLSIGPAGENLVTLANIVVNRSRSASRCGVGAVMGAKNLKAMAVSGSGHVAVADPEGFMDASLEMTKVLMQAVTTKELRRYGTPVSFNRWNELNTVPTRNFQETRMPAELAANIEPDVLRRDHITRNFGCFACPIHCTHYQTVEDGPYAGTKGEKIEHENLWDFGTKLGIDSLPAIIKGSSLCHQLGLDIDNVSGAISWAFECFQRGLLTTEDTGGLELEWGNHPALIELLGRIARREGIGELLAKGSREAARTLGKGSEDFAIHVKGQELAEELRVFKGWGFGVVVSERGGAHTTGAPITEKMKVSEDVSEEFFGIRTAFNPHTYEGKAQLVAYFQRFHAVLECLGSCFFSTNWYGHQVLGPKHFATLYSLATGNDLSEGELMAMGEKVHTLQKLFNVSRGGFARADDYPPKRMMVEPATDSREETGIDRETWDRLLDEYYDIHGWNRETSHPRPQTLQDIGLDEFVDLV